MLDYRPHILENKRKITSNHISDYSEETIATTEDILNGYSNISSDNIFEIIESIKNTSISDSSYKVSNEYLSDVLDYQSHIARVNVIQNEAKVIGDTLCQMLYEDNVSIDEIKTINENILSKLKSGYCDNDALYYLSKIMCIANDYIDNLDSNVRALLYSQDEIKTFVDSGEFLDENINALNRMLIQPTNDLNDQLNTVNYISDNNVVNNYLIKIYNYMIDYSEVKNSELSSKQLVLSGINEKINSTFVDIVRSMEYIKIQNEMFTTAINDKFNQIKNLYIR